MSGSLLAQGRVDTCSAVHLLRSIIEKLEVIAEDGADVLLVLRADTKLYEDLSVFEAEVENDEDDGTSEDDCRTISQTSSFAPVLDMRGGHPVPAWSPPVEMSLRSSHELAVGAGS